MTPNTTKRTGEVAMIAFIVATVAAFFAIAPVFGAVLFIGYAALFWHCRSQRMPDGRGSAAVRR